MPSRKPVHPKKMLLPVARLKSVELFPPYNRGYNIFSTYLNYANHEQVPRNCKIS